VTVCVLDLTFTSAAPEAAARIRVTVLDRSHFGSRTIYPPSPRLVASHLELADMEWPLQTVEVCPLYGHANGCRRGKRCQFLHVKDDGSLAKTRATPHLEPDAPQGYADQFRNLVLTSLRRFLERAGSRTSVLGASFRDGADFVRVTVETAMQPSEEARSVGAARSRRGRGSFHIEPTRHGSEPVFFHGTNVQAGLEILRDGCFKVARNTPVGIYTTLEWPSRPYNDGCVVEILANARLMSIAETHDVIAETQQAEVPEGFICAVKRSVREYVHNPRSIAVLAVTFKTSVLWDALNLQDSRLSVYVTTSARPSILVPKHGAASASILVPKHGAARRALTAKATLAAGLSRPRSRSPRRPEDFLTPKATLAVPALSMVPAPRTPTRPPTSQQRQRAAAVNDDDDNWGEWEA